MKEEKKERKKRLDFAYIYVAVSNNWKKNVQKNISKINNQYILSLDLENQNNKNKSL